MLQLVQEELPSSLRKQRGGTSLEDRIMLAQEKVDEAKAAEAKAKSRFGSRGPSDGQLMQVNQLRKSRQSAENELATLKNERRKLLEGAPPVKMIDPAKLRQRDDLQSQYDQLTADARKFQMQANGQGRVNSILAQRTQIKRRLDQLNKELAY